MFEGVALLAVMLTALGAIGFGVGRERRHRGQWERVADELGVRSAGYDLRGELDGFAVHATATTHERHADFQVQIPITEIRVKLDPPLDMGLRMGRLGATGDEPERAQQLFDQLIRNQLANLDADVHVDDDGVTVERKGRADQRWLLDAIPRATQLARLIDAKRDDLPIPNAIADTFPQWEEVARELDAELHRTPLRIEGAVDGMSLFVTADRERRFVFTTRVVVQFEHSLGMGLRLERRGGQLQRDSDPGIVDEKVERALMAIPEPARVRVTDRFVRSIGDGHMGTMLDATIDAALAIAIAAGQIEDPTKGPYR